MAVLYIVPSTNSVAYILYLCAQNPSLGSDGSHVPCLINRRQMNGLGVVIITQHYDPSNGSPPQDCTTESFSFDSRNNPSQIFEPPIRSCHVSP